MEWREKPARAHPESDLQKAIVAHLRLRGQPDVIWFHPMNNAPVSKRTAGRFKAEGVVAGVPDLCFTLSDGTSAFMELKAIGGRLSPEQKLFQAKCERNGVPYVICNQLDNALSILDAWGAIKPEGKR